MEGKGLKEHTENIVCQCCSSCVQGLGDMLASALRASPSELQSQIKYIIAQLDSGEQWDTKHAASNPPLSVETVSKAELVKSSMYIASPALCCV